VQLTDVPTEQTTAISDALLALVALGCAVCLRRIGCGTPWRTNVWSLAIGLVAPAAALGAIAHGLEISPETEALLWQPLNVAMGLSVALFVVGVVHDAWGRASAGRTLPGMLAAALGFYLLTVLVPGTFLLFALFGLSAMVFAVVAYGWITVRDRREDFALMTAGVALSLIAGAVQTQHSVLITIVWPFDHNGVFHLIQIVSLLVLTAGLLTGRQRCQAATLYY
jgi:hypothetical protein